MSSKIRAQKPAKALGSAIQDVEQFRSKELNLTDKIKISKKNKKLKPLLDNEITKTSIELTHALEESKLIRLKIDRLIKELDLAINKKYHKEKD